jgi:hypothetical protein
VEKTVDKLLRASKNWLNVLLVYCFFIDLRGVSQHARGVETGAGVKKLVHPRPFWQYVTSVETRRARKIRFDESDYPQHRIMRSRSA